MLGYCDVLWCIIPVVQRMNSNPDKLDYQTFTTMWSDLEQRANKSTSDVNITALQEIYFASLGLVWVPNESKLILYTSYGYL